MPTDEAIRERSYLIWEREGRPSGKELEHWVRARAELDGPAPTSARPRARRKAVGGGAAGTAKRSASR